MRDITRTLKEYKDKFGDTDYFFPSDYHQIFKLAFQEDTAINAAFRLVSTALTIGFMVGYEQKGLDE